MCLQFWVFTFQVFYFQVFILGFIQFLEFLFRSAYDLTCMLLKLNIMSNFCYVIRTASLTVALFCLDLHMI
jgi:hypothetical protein